MFGHTGSPYEKSGFKTPPEVPDGLQVAQASPPGDLLLVVFVHGFQGNDSTFAGFPDRLQHVLSETIEDVVVECRVFPAYETRGELTEAVERFSDWLITLTVEREAAHGLGAGAGQAKIVLCGHSMGGLLIADALLEFVNSRSDKQAPLWPKIIACIAFDTPYLGLHPFVFKNSATKAATTARAIAGGVVGAVAGLGTKKTSTPPSRPPIAAITSPSSQAGKKSSWGWAPAAVGGALLAGAAAGAAYYKRDDLNLGYSWATDHLKFVGNLWNEENLRRRVDSLIDVEEQLGVLFRTFYIFLPPDPSRTFIILPPKGSRSHPRFQPAKNGIAQDELQAHTGMFVASTNDGYYELGLVTARLIRDVIMTGRGLPESRMAVVAMSQNMPSAAKEEYGADESLIPVSF